MSFLQIPKQISHINEVQIVTNTSKPKKTNVDCYTVRLHSLAVHIVRNIFNILTFGFVKKSIACTLDGKTIYARCSDIRDDRLITIKNVSNSVILGEEYISVKEILDPSARQSSSLNLEDFTSINTKFSRCIRNGSIFFSENEDDLPIMCKSEIVSKLPPGGIYIFARRTAREAIGYGYDMWKGLEGRPEFKCVISLSRVATDWPKGAGKRALWKAPEAKEELVDCYYFNVGDNGTITDPRNHLKLIIEEKREFDLKKR